MSVRCHAQEPGGGSCNQLTEFMGVIARLAMVGPQWQDKLTDEQIGGTNLVRDHSDRSDAHNLN